MQDQPNQLKKDGKKWLSIMAVALTVVLLILLFMCNRVVVFMQDDLWYSTNLVTGEPVSSVSDIVRSQVWHYFNWGGRTVAHTLLQFLLWGGETVCNILNTLVFAGLSIFLGKIGKKWNAWQILLSAGAIVAFNPNILDTLFWQSGTVNYLYMILLSFPLAGIYLKKISGISSEKGVESVSAENGFGKNPVIQIILTVLFLLWGILAGWTNENIGPTLFLICMVSSVLYMKEIGKIRGWMIGGLTGLAIGSGAVILAPGNMVRNHDIATLGSWKLDLCKRVVDYMQGAFVSLFPVILFAIFSFVLYRTVMKKRPPVKVMLLLGAGAVSYLALVLSPHVPDRSLFGTMCLFIWASGSMINAVISETKKERYRIMIALLLFVSAFHRIFFLWAQGVGWYRYL